MYAKHLDQLLVLFLIAKEYLNSCEVHICTYHLDTVRIRFETNDFISELIMWGDSTFRIHHMPVSEHVEPYYVDSQVLVEENIYNSRYFQVFLHMVFPHNLGKVMTHLADRS